MASDNPSIRTKYNKNDKYVAHPILRKLKEAKWSIVAVNITFLSLWNKKWGKNIVAHDIFCNFTALNQNRYCFINTMTRS